MEFLLSLAVIALFFMHMSLRSRTKDLEDRIQNGVTKKPASPQMRDVPQPVLYNDMSAGEMSHAHSTVPQSPHLAAGDTAPLSAIPVAQMQQPMQSAPPVPHEPSAIATWFKENTLIKVGSIIFFLGAVWFVSYAIAQGWISPVARILMGIGLGVTVAGLGHVRRATSRDQYVTLTALGVGIVIATVFAGQAMFGLFHPLGALVMLLLAIGYAVYVSLATNQQWLGIASAIAAFVAPLMTGPSEPMPVVFFGYLFVISAGFLTVLVRRSWRFVTPVLALGVIFYSLLYYGNGVIEGNVLWLFTVLFTGLFYIGVMVSLVREAEPKSIDVTTLGLVAVSYVSWAHELVVLDGLVTFVAALVVAGTGYALFIRNISDKVVAIPAGLAGLLVLVGTSFAFDGFTAVVAYALEIGVAVAVVSYLRFSGKVLFTTGSLFMLPVLIAFASWESSDWDTGVIHETGFSAYVLTAVSCALSVWLVRLYKAYGMPSHLQLSAVFGFLSYFWLAVTTIAFWPAAFSNIEGSGALADVVTYVSLYVASICLCLYVYTQQLPRSWFSVSVASFSLPFILSLQSFMSGSWNDGVAHADALGAAITLLILYVMSSLFISHMKSEGGVSEYRQAAAAFLGLSWGMSTIFLWQFWKGLISYEEIALVLSYVSWAVLSYVFIYALYQLRLPKSWWGAACFSLGLAVFASLGSLDYGAWKSGILDPQAVGLYAMTVMFLVLAMTFLREMRVRGEGGQYLGWFVRAFFIAAGGYSFVTVWVVTHAQVASPDTAVVISLFIYTVAGLVFYLLGKQTNRNDFKLAAGILLSAVVARLALVEVWNMDPFWRIITFMGIGALFILTALVEKPFQNDGVKESLIPKRRDE